jgi:repressor LexA
MARTSNKAQLIVEFVNRFVQENGFAPSVREIGEAVGLRSTASVSYHLQQLKAQGLLQAPEGKGRKRSIVANFRPGQIPVVGVVTAGLPILAVENHEGTMAWDGDPSCFALRVRGDSMINAGILDGDKVVVRPQPTAHEGQIVVARIGDEATVKRISFKNGIWLLPENPNYDPIDGTEAELIGLVKAVVREY